MTPEAPANADSEWHFLELLGSTVLGLGHAQHEPEGRSPVLAPHEKLPIDILLANWCQSLTSGFSAPEVSPATLEVNDAGRSADTTISIAKDLIKIKMLVLSVYGWQMEEIIRSPEEHLSSIEEMLVTVPEPEIGFQILARTTSHELGPFENYKKLSTPRLYP
ncbi:hypothetical protein AX15_005778 [Amanita polypyramis BW_CC]|nr:hypothetical protein AX15_005778 [Amanita polypyramis BW_CC]